MLTPTDKFCSGVHDEDPVGELVADSDGYLWCPECWAERDVVQVEASRLLDAAAAEAIAARRVGQ